MQKITPFLWFDKNCEEAVNFYVSVFKDYGHDANVVHIQRYPEGPLEGPMKGMEGKVLTGVFELDGQQFMALDGGPVFKFNESISFIDRKSTRLNSSHVSISYAVFCLKKKRKYTNRTTSMRTEVR